MHKKFNHKEIEQKWQKKWSEQSLYKTDDSSSKPKQYILDMFPYPSGEGLHVGHPKGYIATDIYSRFKKMSGFEVLHPMGWDAFGLPAENYAIKNKVHPRVAVEQNIANFKGQLAKLGLNYDWTREINTTDPEYYKWTQWIFLKLLEKGLAFESYEPINWCPSCQTGLANEDLESDGTCERCGSVVEKKPMRQWVLRITDYADRMLTDLDTLDKWPAHIKEAQRQWIGRSEGAKIDFPLNLPSVTGEIVFATNNTGKVERMQKLALDAGLNITIKTPQQIGITDFNVTEDQNTLRGNVEKKAKALSQLTDLPVLADDSGFFIEGEEINPVTVKRNALGTQKESELSVEEIGLMMADYYKKIASTHGGEVLAEWKNSLCLIHNGEVKHTESVRPVMLTDTITGKFDPYLPIRCLYKPIPTGKYVSEQTKEEELLELKPITDALKKLLTPSIEVFTTRPDTLYGATYVVIAPEHDIVVKYKGVIQNWAEIGSYVEATKKKDDIERTKLERDKTGVKLEGITAINPANGEVIPVYIADYVLMNYGTGAIMAVPAHDERDFVFAKKFGIGIKYVVYPKKFSTIGTVNSDSSGNILKDIIENSLEAVTSEGELFHSQEFDGMSSEEASTAITAKVGGRMTSTYRLNDWVFSRQRYWGEPIPIIHCESCGIVPVPYSELPVVLPEVEHYEPTGTGESPLANIEEWVNTPCPKCNAPAKRETNTMPQWAGSSWYYLRFMDPQNQNALVDSEKEKSWGPVDVYVGGDHAVRHLIYARFWHKFLYDIGVVHTIEPFKRLEFLGFILAEDGRKMSKRWGNVINPDDIVEVNGADTLRVYEMFMGPFENTVSWSTDSLVGAQRFLERAHGLDSHITNEEKNEISQLLYKTVRKVSSDIEAFKFNTAVSSLMIFLNHAEKFGLSENSYLIFVKLLAPFAPHLTEELWNNRGQTGSIHLSEWPHIDEAKLIATTVTYSVQIDGKMRGRVEAKIGATQEEVIALILNDENLKSRMMNQPKRVIFVPNKIINIVF